MSLKYEIVSSGDSSCSCSVKHIPYPVQLAVIEVDEGEIYLCPSGLFNLLDLLRQWDLTGAKPAGSITKHYGKYLRDLATQIKSR